VGWGGEGWETGDGRGGVEEGECVGRAGGGCGLGRCEMEDGEMVRCEMRDARCEMGDGKWDMGDGAWGMGNGKWDMGNGKWERL